MKQEKNIIGYARVSTSEQDISSQTLTLKKASCTKIFSDKSSGARAERPGLDTCLESLKKGDTLVVTRLDRLGRSMPHLVSLINELKSKGIYFRSIGDGAIDTSTASGELIFHIFAALAEFERALIRERTKAGLDAARARGKLGGRIPISANNPTVLTAKKMHKDSSLSIAEICRTLSISRSTLYRYLKL